MGYFLKQHLLFNIKVQDNKTIFYALFQLLYTYVYSEATKVFAQLTLRVSDVTLQWILLQSEAAVPSIFVPQTLVIKFFSP